MGNRRAAGPLAAIVLWLLLSATAPACAARTFEAYVGSVATLDLGAIAGMAVGNDQVVQASVADNGKLLLLGKAPGVSELVVWSDDGHRRKYKIRVYPGPPADKLSRIRSVLASFPGVRVSQHLGQTVLDGTVDSADFKRFQNVLGSFPDIVSLVEPRLNVELQDTIVFDVMILELSRRYEHTLGVRWQDTAAGPAIGIVGNIVPNNEFGVFSGGSADVGNLLDIVGSGASTLRGYFGISSILESQLELLQEEGVARVLAEPSLATVSGEPATFLAGGDFPVAILNQFGQPVVDFREYGIQLEIKPVMDRKHNIRAHIRTEVSSIDFSVQVNGVPGLRRREAVSTITARPGQTIVISGLLNTADSRSIDKVPGLAEIPVLGALFRSKDFQQQRTELVITVTPHIREAGASFAYGTPVALRRARNVLKGSDALDKWLLK